MIIVSGATDPIGQELVSMLQVSGMPFKVLSSDRKHTRAILGPDVACVTGDLNRPATLKAAFGGADRLFLFTPYNAKMHAQLKEAIRVARISGIKHIVMVSGPDILMPVEVKSALGALAWEAEEALIRSGTDYTILRPSYLMQTLIDEQRDMIRNRGLMRGHIMAEAPVPMVDGRDVAGVAYAALAYSGHKGKTYSLFGEPVTFDQIADLMSDVLNDTIVYEPASGLRTKSGAVRTGQSKWALQLEKDWAKVFAAGGGDFTNNAIADVTGYQARSFGEFLMDHLEDFE